MERCGVGRVDNWRTGTTDHIVHHRRRHNRDNIAQTGSQHCHHHHSGGCNNDCADNRHNLTRGNDDHNTWFFHHKPHNDYPTKPHDIGPFNGRLNQWPYNGLVPLAFQA